MEPITIRWETGYMTINPDAFFPTSTARIRKKKREFEAAEATAEKLRQNAEVLKP